MQPQLDPDDPIVRTAVFGRQVEDFLSSEIGKYLLDRAKLEEEDGLSRLSECDPLDSNGIRALQDIIKRAKSIQTWLSDAVISGHQALNDLENR